MDGCIPVDHRGRNERLSTAVILRGMDRRERPLDGLCLPVETMGNVRDDDDLYGLLYLGPLLLGVERHAPGSKVQGRRPKRCGDENMRNATVEVKVEYRRAPWWPVVWWIAVTLYRLRILNDLWSAAALLIKFGLYIRVASNRPHLGGGARLKFRWHGKGRKGGSVSRQTDERQRTIPDGRQQHGRTGDTMVGKAD